MGRLFVAVGFRGGRMAYYPRRQLEAVVRSSPDGSCVPLGFDGERVPSGSHLCLLPSSKNELIRLIARYVAVGLEAGDNCACTFPAGWNGAVREAMEEMGVEVDDALGSRGLVIASTRDIYLPPSDFTVDKQLERTERVVASLAERSGRGARYFGCPRKELFRVEDWWEYERQATPLLKTLGVTTVCGYDAGGRKTGQWERAEAVHPYVVKEGAVLATDAAS